MGEEERPGVGSLGRAGAWASAMLCTCVYIIELGDATLFLKLLACLYVFLWCCGCCDWVRVVLRNRETAVPLSIPPR